MIHYWLYGAAVVLVVLCVARVLFLFLFRMPVQARTCGTDLTEMQRCYDGEMYWLARSDGLSTPDDVPVRHVRVRVAYDIDGVGYRADVSRLTRKGDRTDAVSVIWYDPADPRRVTAIGLGPALALLPVSVALVAIGCHLRI